MLPSSRFDVEVTVARRPHGARRQESREAKKAREHSGESREKSRVVCEVVHERGTKAGIAYRESASREFSLTFCLEFCRSPIFRLVVFSLQLTRSAIAALPPSPFGGLAGWMELEVITMFLHRSLVSRRRGGPWSPRAAQALAHAHAPPSIAPSSSLYRKTTFIC